MLEEFDNVDDCRDDIDDIDDIDDGINSIALGFSIISTFYTIYIKIHIIVRIFDNNHREIGVLYNLYKSLVEIISSD